MTAKGCPHLYVHAPLLSLLSSSIFPVLRLLSSLVFLNFSNLFSVSSPLPQLLSSLLSSSSIPVLLSLLSSTPSPLLSPLPLCLVAPLVFLNSCLLLSPPVSPLLSPLLCLLSPFLCFLLPPRPNRYTIQQPAAFLPVSECFPGRLNQARQREGRVNVGQPRAASLNRANCTALTTQPRLR